MEPSFTFTSVVLVNHDLKAFTDCFLVETTPNDRIFHLRWKVKEYFHGSNDFPQLRLMGLTMPVMWELIGAMVINKFSSCKRMPEILSAIDINVIQDHPSLPTSSRSLKPSLQPLSRG